MTDKYVGTDIGIYHIESLNDELAPDGHKVYHVKCRYCEFENDMKMWDIKQPQICKHIANTGRVIDFKMTWSSKKLKSVFYDMVSRCYNKNNKGYKWYGAKGVKVCDEWLNNPKAFDEWALNSGYQEGLTIDRIDSDKDYSPENCRWLTLEENSRRAGNVNWITVNGETLTGKQWAYKLGIGTNTINKLLKKHGLEKTTQLIEAMLLNPSLKQQQDNSKSWFDIYNIAV